MGRLVDIDDVIKAVDKHTKDEFDIVLDEDISVILEKVPTATFINDEKNKCDTCDLCFITFAISFFAIFMAFFALLMQR